MCLFVVCELRAVQRRERQTASRHKADVGSATKALVGIDTREEDNKTRRRNKNAVWTGVQRPAKENSNETHDATGGSQV